MTDLQTRIENANPRPDCGADDLIPPFDAIWLAAQQTIAQEHARITRRRTISSRLVAAGVALTVAGGGYAAAAASGVVPSPWSGPAVNTFVASPDPAGTVRLAVPGPESTILQIVTNTVPVGNGTAECTGLVVKEPQGRSVHVMSACGGPSAARAENGVFDWQAPSGATFSIVTGEAPASAAKVSLTDRSGTAATEPTGGGYFVAYVPTQEMPANGTLDFYNSSGQIIGSQTFGAVPTGGS
jgi:hypothetical protein